MVQVEVDGQVFNNIGIGETFDNGRYELRSVSGDCATFVFGDESFTLCASSDQVARRGRTGSGGPPTGGAVAGSRGRPFGPPPLHPSGAPHRGRPRLGRPRRVPYDVPMLRMLTAGESHGKALVAVLEGLPAGVPVDPDALAHQLARRRHGHGRGGRQRFESDRFEILARRSARPHARLADRGDDPEPGVRREVRRR